jgi:hypothetical protein
MVNAPDGARRFPGTWRVCISRGRLTHRREIMANSGPGGARDYNTTIIEEFRANGGHVGGPWAGTAMILVHHIGARSGIERVSPLACSPQGNGRFAIVASNGGSSAHPDWYYNLKANPRMTLEEQA